MKVPVFFVLLISVAFAAAAATILPKQDETLNTVNTNTTVSGTFAIKAAIANGNVLTMQTILDDDGVNLTEQETYDILAFAVKMFKGSFKPLQVLMNHRKVTDSGLAIRSIFSEVVVRNRLDLVDWLLKQEAIDPTYGNNYSIKSAVRLGLQDIVERIFQHPKVNAGANENFLLVVAVARRDHRMVKLLLNNQKVNPNDRDGLFLAEAVEIGDYFIMQNLITRIENPSANGNIALRLALLRQDLKMIRMLLAHPKISLNIPTYYPPVYLAIQTGNLEIVKALGDHPKFAESYPKLVIDESVKVAEKRNYVEIGNYLKTLNVTGRQEDRITCFSNIVYQLDMRMKSLLEIVFNSSLERRMVKSTQEKRELMRPFVKALLEELFSGKGDSRKAGFEMLKMTFVDFRAYAKNRTPPEGMQQAFVAFVNRNLGMDVGAIGNGSPADLKRKREEGQVTGSSANGMPMGEQEPPRTTGEASSSAVPVRNVRRRLNFDADGDAGNGEGGGGNRGIEAEKQPEDA